MERSAERRPDWAGLPVIATVARLLCRELILQNEYLRLGNRIPKEKVSGRIRFRDEERRALVEAARAMGRSLRQAVVSIVRPEALLAWQRRLEQRKWDYRERRRRGAGRPRTADDIAPWRVGWHGRMPGGVGCHPIHPASVRSWTSQAMAGNSAPPPRLTPLPIVQPPNTGICKAAGNATSGVAGASWEPDEFLDSTAGPAVDPLLCVPASRRVCLCREAPPASAGAGDTRGPDLTCRQCSFSFFHSRPQIVGGPVARAADAHRGSHVPLQQRTAMPVAAARGAGLRRVAFEESDGLRSRLQVRYWHLLDAARLGTGGACWRGSLSQCRAPRARGRRRPLLPLPALGPRQLLPACAIPCGRA